MLSRYSSVRHSHITEDIKKKISAKEVEFTGAVTTADRQLVALENKLEDLNLSSDDNEEAGPRAKPSHCVNLKKNSEDSKRRRSC